MMKGVILVHKHVPFYLFFFSVLSRRFNELLRLELLLAQQVVDSP